MSISPIHPANLHPLTASKNKTELATTSKTGQASPLESRFQVNQDYLKLVIQSALEKLNEVLAPDLGPNSIQKAYEEGLDVSPEATADRIVNLSTALFDRYQGTRSNDNADQVFGDFMNVIRKGIDQGFQEARDILAGLQVLQGSIQENIDRTYVLVQDKLANFEQQYQEGNKNESS